MWPGAVAMLVLTPVRELSMQVAKEAEKLTSFYQSCRGSAVNPLDLRRFEKVAVNEPMNMMI